MGWGWGWTHHCIHTQASYIHLEERQHERGFLSHWEERVHHNDREVKILCTYVLWCVGVAFLLRIGLCIHVCVCVIDEIGRNMNVAFSRADVD